MAKGCSSERTRPKEDPGANWFGTGEESRNLKGGSGIASNVETATQNPRKKKIKKRVILFYAHLKKGACAATVSTRSCSPLGKELPLVAVGFAAQKAPIQGALLWSGLRTPC